jgi:3-methyladenine DNA glycosylase AlkC
MEQISIDMGALLAHAFPDLSGQAAQLRQGGLVNKLRAGGRILFDAFGEAAPALALPHRSDTVRGWGAMALARDPSLTPAERLDALRPFAADEHFAVREWAWLAFRPTLISDLSETLALLRTWTLESSSLLRRFASEASRPRGVWSPHVPELKRNPERAEPLLSALRADPARYVQRSVANWLNDASRTRPDWVESVCAGWLAGDAPAETVAICKRARRSLGRSA